MPRFDHITYFGNIATSLTDIADSGGNDHFHLITNLNTLEEFLAQKHSLQGYQLLLMDYVRGRFVDNKSDNPLNQNFFTFFLLKAADESIFTGKNSTVSAVRTVCDKIIAKMLHDKRNYNSLMERLDVSSINYEQVGPIAGNWHGLNYSFVLMDNPGTLPYDEEDWS